MPFFSVVIPVYNREKLIPPTIQSVLAQTFTDYELIIINDGSTDNTEIVIKEIVAGNPGIKYIWQENSERGAARNNGFRNSSGKYVTFLDSDDLMEPEHLAVLHKKIMEQHEPNFIATKYVLLRGNIKRGTMLQSLPEGYYNINLVLSGSHFGCNFSVKKDNPGLLLFEEDRMYAIFEDWRFIVQNLDRERIYIVDANTIIMNDHDERSMRVRDHVLVSKRILAANWIEKNIDLTLAQKKILWGFSFYFCAIHSYSQGKRKETFLFLLKSIRLVGFDKTKIELMIKNILGYKMVQFLKR